MGTRHPFFGGSADWAFDTDGTGAVLRTAGAAITLWNARTGGTQHTDLSLEADGSTPVTGVLTSDGTDGYLLGDVPIVFGPDDVVGMWYSADGGPRKFVATTDVAALAAATAASLTALLASGDPLTGRSVTFARAGALATGAGKFYWTNLTGVDLTLRALSFYLETAGSSSSVFDVNVNGTTLYATGKPTLISGAHSLILSTSFTVPAGARLSMDVDSAGAGAADFTGQADLW